jgi:uncharacterized C2H2 Zn-finger protein
LTTERLNHDSIRAAALAAALDHEFGVPKEINHARLQEIISKKKVDKEEENNGESEKNIKINLQRLEISITYLLRVHNYAYLSGRQFNSVGQRFELMGDAGFFWPYTERDVVVEEKDKKLPTKQTAVKNDDEAETESTSSNNKDISGQEGDNATKTEEGASTSDPVDPVLKRDRTTHSRIIDGPVDKRMRLCAPTQVSKREKQLLKSESELSNVINVAIDEMVARNTKRESPKRYRCTLSGKLFSEPKFVRKHILSKHGHLVDRSKKEAIIKYMYNMYMKDPKKRVSPRMREMRQQQNRRNGDVRGGMNKGTRKRGRDNSNGNIGAIPSLMSTGSFGGTGGTGGTGVSTAGGFRAFTSGNGRNVKKPKLSKGDNKGPKLPSYANVNSMDDDDVQYERR